MSIVGGSFKNLFEKLTHFSAVSHFLPPHVFWRFQGVYKCDTGLKWVKRSVHSLENIGSAWLKVYSEFFIHSFIYDLSYIRLKSLIS